MDALDHGLAEDVLITDWARPRDCRHGPGRQLENYLWTQTHDHDAVATSKLALAVIENAIWDAQHTKTWSLSLYRFLRGYHGHLDFWLQAARVRDTQLIKESLALLADDYKARTRARRNNK